MTQISMPILPIDIVLIPEKIDQLTHNRIKGYPTSLEQKTHTSHISFGFGTIDEKLFPLPKTISFDKIALVHMGKRCTSYEIIEEFSLKNMK